MRVTNLATSNHLISLLMRNQTRLQDLEVQVASEKKSQDYAGIASSSERLVGLENSRHLFDRFVRNNDIMKLRLDVTAATVDGIERTSHDFRKLLLDVGGGQPLERQQVDQIQQWAFRALKDLESYLNTEVDGRHLFAGSRVTTRPVDLDLTTLDDFQARFDGAAVTFANTRDAHLENFSVSADANANTNWLIFAKDPGGNGGPSRITATTSAFSNLAPGAVITLSGTPGGTNDGTFVVDSVGGGGTTIDVVTRQFAAEGPVAVSLSAPGGILLGPGATGGLTFATGANDTITAAVAGSLAALPEGSVFTVDGGTNAGTYTVLSNDGTTATIASKKLFDQGGAGSEVAGTIAAASYYRGDQVALTHRVDDSRDFKLDLTAVDPAFEKAIRALGLIAQGRAGSEGGLDQNRERIDEAIALLNHALDRGGDSPLPFGPELAGNIETVRMDIGFQQVLVAESNEHHRAFLAFLDGNIAEEENADSLETITRLLDDARAIEASFQAIARIRQLSLASYLGS